MGRNLEVKRGDIWLVNLDPTIGAEIKKNRPALVIQNDVGNEHAPTTIIAPITTQNTEQTYPTDAPITGLEKPSKTLLSQIRAVDKQRLVKKLHYIEDMRAVEAALKISLQLS